MDAASDLVIVDHDGHTFISIEYVERIPTEPSDTSVKKFFLDASVDFPLSACVVRTRQNKLFFSLHYLNRVLSSLKKARPLRVHLAIRTDSDDDQHMILHLRDLDGNNVPLKEPNSAGHDALRMVVHQNGASLANPEVESQQVTRTEGSPQLSQHTAPLAKEQQSSSQQGAGLQLSTRILKEQLSHTALPNAPWGLEVVLQDRAVTNLSATRRAARTLDEVYVHSHAAGRLSRQGNSTLWEQLRDVKMTENDVLEALSDGEIPKALSVLGDTPNTVIPFGMMPNGENFSIRPFEKAKWLPGNLGIVRNKDFVESFRERQLLPKIKEYCKVAEQLRGFILRDKPIKESLKSCAGTHTHKGRVKKTLSRMSSHLHHTFETCLPRVRRFQAHYDSILELQRAGSPGNFVARSMKEQADEILDMSESLDDWKQSAQLLPGGASLNRLVRKVVPSDKVRVSVEYPLPRYVLPLGRLCRLGDNTNEPMDLDEILVMDVTSPHKALWCFRFSSEAMSSCCFSFEMLAADIEHVRPYQKPGGENGGGWKRHAVQDGEEREPSNVNELAGRHPDSRINFTPGNLIFSSASATHFTEAITHGWRPVSLEKTRKRENEDEEPRSSQRKRRKSNEHADERTMPFIVEDDGEPDTWAGYRKRRRQHPNRTAMANSSSQQPQLLAP